MPSPGNIAVVVNGAVTFNPTDAGNAERIVARYGDSIRYVHGWDRWHVWDGARWARDERREVEGFAIDSARAMLVESAGATTQKECEALAKHALRSEEKHAIDDALALARSMSPVAITPDVLDLDPDLLNVANGTIDLRTGKLLLHSPAHNITKIAPVAYDPEATAPTWEAFLATVIPDAAERAYLQRAVGYSLTAHTNEHAMFFNWGRGKNGKTTFIERIRKVLGEGDGGYAKAAAPHLLLASRQDRHLTEIADLRGARFVTAIEVDEGRSWDETKVKWLTGGDVISARRMYENQFSFTPTHKFWVAGNHKPTVRGTDEGFWRRVHLVPFTVTIPEEQRDRDLGDKLDATELPGILRWAVQGCIAWRKDGLRPPTVVTEATKEYRAAEDVVGAFVDERCTLAPGKHVLRSSRRGPSATANAT
jgi:putative DNA primase/helicase